MNRHGLADRIRVTPLVLAVMTLLATAAGHAFAQAGDAEEAELPADPRFPDKPGVHHLAFRYSFNDQPRKMTFGVYLPEKVKYIGPEKKLPMVVFLSGVGERGDDRKNLYANGPIAAMARIKGLARHLDFIVLVPQCPRDQRWRSDGMPAYVDNLIKRSIENMPVDPDRVYLTGLSMGGTGTWYVARHAPRTFAAIAPICGRAVEPDKTAEALAEVPTWIIVGGSDSEAFTDGAKRMRDAQKQAGAHVRLTVVPGAGHGVWRSFYSKPAFYRWLLQHQRGGRIHDLSTDERLLRIAFTPPPDPQRAAFERKLAKQLEEFAPYWHIDGCGTGEQVGRHDKLAGRENVLVTRPLHPEVPCRLMFTADLEAGSKPRLRIVAGHAPEGRWLLTVKLGNDEALRKLIDAGVTEEGWTTFELDLSKYAGQNLPIQLQHEAADRESNPAAYWDAVEVVSGE